MSLTDFWRLVLSWKMRNLRNLHKRLLEGSSRKCALRRKIILAEHSSCSWLNQAVLPVISVRYQDFHHFARFEQRLMSLLVSSLVRALRESWKSNLWCSSPWQNVSFPCYHH